jgi:pimeloyl-ACP methyl ester carboxylesterase
VGYLFWGFWLAAQAATSRLILRLYFRPRSVRQKPEELASWQSGTAFTVKLHGRNLRGRYWGEDPGGLMMHGWNGHGSQFHRFVNPVVERGYRAILIDGPAHGESDGSYTTYFEFTDMVRYLLRGDAGMQVEKVIAHSFGAAVVINALHKEQLSADVALVAPALAFEGFLQESFRKAGFPLFFLCTGRLGPGIEVPQTAIGVLAQNAVCLVKAFDESHLGVRQHHQFHRFHQLRIG